MQAMQHEPGTNIVANGALATLSGEPYVCPLAVFCVMKEDVHCWTCWQHPAE